MVESNPISEKGKELADLFAEVNALLMDHPEVLAKMPDDFILVALAPDEELASYALSLVPSPPDKAVVYALIQKEAVIFLLPQGPLQAKLEAA
jgi:hypothetical protein